MVVVLAVPGGAPAVALRRRVVLLRAAVRVVGRGMGGGMGGPRTFNLDGSETTGEMGRGKFARKATLSSDGKTLELVSKMTFQTPDGNEVTTNSTDKLTLSADGKSLTVVASL